MHFFQKYFPELSPGEQHATTVAEAMEFPNQLFSVPRLASEILQFTQSRRRDQLHHWWHGRVGNSGGLRFAHVARLESLQEGNGVEGEARSDAQASGSDAAGKAKGRNSWNDMPKFLLAGAVSTIISRTFVAPLERIKLECIVQGSSFSWVRIIHLIWASEGLRGFWKGNTLNLFRMVPFKSINFICYDMYLDRLLSIPGKTEITNTDRLVGGGISGVLATVVCLPLDTAMSDPDKAGCTGW